MNSIQETTTGKRIAYVRVSTDKQLTDRQDHAMKDFHFDKIFKETASGKSKKSRPVLNEMLEYLREGDHVFVYSISRIARNILDFHGIIKQLQAKCVDLHLVKENLVISNTGMSAHDKLFLDIMAAFAAFESDIISERTREGLAAARAKGKKLGGRKIKFTPLQMQEIKNMNRAGIPKTRIAREKDCAVSLVYKICKGLYDEYIKKGIDNKEIEVI